MAGLYKRKGANLPHFHDRHQRIHDRFTAGSYPLAREYDASPHTLTGDLTMKNDKEIVRIDLTPEQKQLVKKEIGKEGDSVELTVKELVERIAPRAML